MRFSFPMQYAGLSGLGSLGVYVLAASWRLRSGKIFSFKSRVAMHSGINIFWFRRDLRLKDNAGLYYALRKGGPVYPLFIFDRNILDLLENKADRRVEFIQAALVHM